MDVETLGRYLDLAAATPGAGALRIVLEQEGGPLPSRESIVRFLDAAMPRLEAAGRALAIENHFHIPCRLLAEVAETYPAELVRFCIDSANSLRNWEAPEDVFRLLGGRAEFYHLKDYAVSGSNVGFQVGGAPLGCGQLNLRWCLEEMFRRHATPLVLLENWVPASGNWEEDVAADGKWLVRSLEGLRAVLPA
jgi:sugar phosphate isomerase/epimerase